MSDGVVVAAGGDSGERNVIKMSLPVKFKKTFKKLLNVSSSS
jgi:hypothetical protein